jgi:hypothetical protein
MRTAADLSRDVQRGTLGVKSILDGQRKAGMLSGEPAKRDQELSLAKASGLYVKTTSNGHTVVAKTKDDASELVQFLASKGFGKTHEDKMKLSRLLGYPEEQTEIFGRLLRHRETVEAALAAGKPVPAEVLADYPDLARKPEAAKETSKVERKKESGPAILGMSEAAHKTSNSAREEYKRQLAEVAADTSPGEPSAKLKLPKLDLGDPEHVKALATLADEIERHTPGTNPSSDPLQFALQRLNRLAGAKIGQGPYIGTRKDLLKLAAVLRGIPQLQGR